MQPASLALQVRVVNAVAAAAGRPVSFVSFTVPQYQREESYFAPLAGLDAGSAGTELNFALVPSHPAEQAAGTTGDQVRLINTALAASPDGRRDWGTCTECGMGRVGPGRRPGAAGPAPGDHHQPIANRFAAVVRITSVHLPLRYSPAGRGMTGGIAIQRPTLVVWRYQRAAGLYVIDPVRLAARLRPLSERPWSWRRPWRSRWTDPWRRSRTGKALTRPRSGSGGP